MGKEIVFVITQMNACGAEKMAAFLCNEFYKREKTVTLIITHQKKEDAFLEILLPQVKVINLEEEIKTKKKHFILSKFVMYRARILAKIERGIFRENGDLYLIRKYYSRNYDKIQWLKRYFSKHKNVVIISFLYQSIFHTLLSATKNNKVIISERADPKQCLSSSTNVAFFRTMFPKADVMVFQSEGAKEWFCENTTINSTVIYNPVRSDLPIPNEKKREKTVVNFCRYARQKNLKLLIDAFADFWESHQDYTLKIIGGESSDGGDEYIQEIKKHARKSICAEKIFLLPESLHVHEDVINDGMFVSSSDYEGMSNSMLEAMAIGLPAICTDCPAGGARAIIQDHENGILTPVGDMKALSDAMTEVADDIELAYKLSKNGMKIREKLSSEHIIDQWIKIIEK